MVQMKNDRGLTLVELVIAVSIVTILVVVLGYEFTGWVGRFNIEGQVKQLYADMTSARIRALQRNRLHFVEIGTSSYQIYEDTASPFGGTVHSVGDTALWTAAKPLKYPANAAVNMVIDTRGLIAPDPALVRFNVSADPDKPDADIDCINLTSIRITMGKWAGGTCVAK